MNNNTVPTHSVVDPREGSQTPPLLASVENQPLFVYILYEETAWAFTVVAFAKPPLPSGKN